MIKEAMAILDKVVDAVTPSALEHPMTPALVSGNYDWKTQKGGDVHAFGTTQRTSIGTNNGAFTDTNWDSFTD